MGRFKHIFLGLKSCYFVTNCLKRNTGLRFDGNKPCYHSDIIVTFNMNN